LLQSLPAGAEWIGRQPPQTAYNILGEAAVLIFPSQCHETFGRAIAESFAKGTPVIASNLGASPEMIDVGRTGVLFDAGNARDLADKIELLISDTNRLRQMRMAARQEYELKYTGANNYIQLMDLYRQALGKRHKNESAEPHNDELGRRQSA
jgi:glycosyltransferase involved in cell wall biosynthesis